MILFQDQLLEREEIHVDIEDRGFQFGDGIYEVIKVYNGMFFLMDEHLQRLERSAAELDLSLPYPIDRMKGNLRRLLKANELHNGHVYLQISRGAAQRSHHFPENTTSTFVAYTTETERPMSLIQNGIKATLTEDIRWLRCDIKSLNLLGNVLAKQKAKDKGCQEAILHRDQSITEGSSSNVFVVKDDKLITHPATNLILNGITRLTVIKLAEKLGISVIEGNFTVEELFGADEVMITSTTMEISPVVQIDDKPIDSGSPGKVTKTLQEKFEQLIRQNGAC
jgi:D-alanine transaminase